MHWPYPGIAPGGGYFYSHRFTWISVCNSVDSSYILAVHTVEYLTLVNECKKNDEIVSVNTYTKT